MNFKKLVEEATKNMPKGDIRVNNPNPSTDKVRNSQPLKVLRIKKQQQLLNKMRKVKKGQVDDLPDYFTNSI